MSDRILTPARWTRNVTAYRREASSLRIDLALDGNEGLAHGQERIDSWSRDSRLVRDYPSLKGLEELLGQRLGVPSRQVLVTAGADEALDRVCRTFLEPGREAILATPTFAMIPRYVELAGGKLRQVPWDGDAFPVDEVLTQVNSRTALIVMVTPNNPTGAVATTQDLERLALAVPQALILVDHAYVEFCEEDLTEQALTYPNAVVVRSLSKAWGLAGLRVGYAVGAAPVVDWLRAAAGPYPVSAVSAAWAAEGLRESAAQMRAFVAQVRGERQILQREFRDHGIAAQTSHGNFVFARSSRARWLARGLASLGISIRTFGAAEDSFRVTCPGNEAHFQRLRRAIRTVLNPEALLFDLDGVIADVSRSYRRTIVETAASFSVTVGLEDIAVCKRQGDANNDWIVARRLIRERGVSVTLDQVRERFEEIYQGDEREPGLRRFETALVDRSLFEALGSRVRLAVVTGRPRQDAERFLEEFDLTSCFEEVVCMEDAPAKPDPEPVRLAMARLGVTSAWMVGDTPDDLRAARGAQVLPLGVVAPGEEEQRARPVLERAGAVRVLRDLAELCDWNQLQGGQP